MMTTVSWCCFCGVWFQTLGSSDKLYCSGCASQASTDPFWPQLLEYKRYIQRGGNPEVLLPEFKEFIYRTYLAETAMAPRTS